MFQSAHPVQDAIYIYMLRLEKNLCFNLRTRTGCDHKQMAASRKLGFQSAHPYRMRLQQHCRRIEIAVSICAPVQDAITFDCLKILFDHVSICAPVQDAMITPKSQKIRYIHRFNLRTRTGCDKIQAILDGLKPVSICAPVQDAIMLKIN